MLVCLPVFYLSICLTFSSFHVSPSAPLPSPPFFSAISCFTPSVSLSLSLVSNLYLLISPFRVCLPVCYLFICLPDGFFHASPSTPPPFSFYALSRLSLSPSLLSQTCMDTPHHLFSHGPPFPTLFSFSSLPP